jgi:hypothetical protein
MAPLWPREHGAYAQLGVPLAAALVARTPKFAGSLLAVAACLAFLANEPLLVMLGHRGKRARTALGELARRRLIVTAGAAIATGIAGLVLAPPIALAVAAAVAIPSAALIVLGWRRHAHSWWGELVAAIALPGASAPVAVAGGASVTAALACWLAWSIGYGASVVAVHHVLAGKRRTRAGDLLRLGMLGVTGLLIGIAARPLPALVVAAPLVALAGVIASVTPSARRVRAIGVAMVVASTVSAVLAVIAA